MILPHYLITFPWSNLKNVYGLENVREISIQHNKAFLDILILTSFINLIKKNCKQLVLPPVSFDPLLYIYFYLYSCKSIIYPRYNLDTIKWAYFFFIYKKNSLGHHFLILWPKEVGENSFCLYWWIEYPTKDYFDIWIQYFTIWSNAPKHVYFDKNLKSETQNVIFKAFLG